MPGAGKRGFTLFTALVAFILIVLTILLVQAMIGAERNTTDIVSDIGEQAEMQAVADLARADALQTFNHGIRVVLEEHFTQSEAGAGGTGSAPTNYITIEYDKTEWEGDESIQDQFLKSWLGDKGRAGDERVGAFANRAANHLSTILAQAPDVHIHRPRRHIDGIPPDPLQQKLTGENPAAVFQNKFLVSGPTVLQRTIKLRLRILNQK